jgi:CrcB protein
MNTRRKVTPKMFLTSISVVALGGFVGTIIRDLLMKLQPASNQLTWVSHIPWVLAAINLSGIYIATRLLVGPLRDNHFDNPVRLLLITGLLGGYTSYSAIFVTLSGIWHLSVGAAFLTFSCLFILSLFSGWLGLKGAKE